MLLTAVNILPTGMTGVHEEERIARRRVAHLTTVQSVQSVLCAFALVARIIMFPSGFICVLLTVSICGGCVVFVLSEC